jgi:hypothetical protein
LLVGLARVKRWVKQNRAALSAIPILIIAIATPALAQSTVIMPLPGANGYAVIPPRQGFTTQVLPMPGGGSGRQRKARRRPGIVG